MSSSVNFMSRVQPVELAIPEKKSNLEKFQSEMDQKDQIINSIALPIFGVSFFLCATIMYDLLLIILSLERPTRININVDLTCEGTGLKILAKKMEKFQPGVPGYKDYKCTEEELNLLKKCNTVEMVNALCNT